MRSTIFVLGLMLAATVFSAENVTIQVQGMSCGSCAASVKSALKGIDGVSDARVSYEQGQAVVTYDSTKTTPEAIARADTRVTIPMAGRVESLNAAVAAAILLYEARRQRA